MAAAPSALCHCTFAFASASVSIRLAMLHHSPQAARPTQGSHVLATASSPPALQAQYLRDLNRSGQHDAVVQLFESDRLVQTEEVFAQYVRALAKADKLNGTALMQTLYRGAQSYLGHNGAAAAAPGYATRAAAADCGGGGGLFGAGGSFASSALRPGSGGGFALPGFVAAGAAGAAGAALGSSKNPLYMMQAEPTFWSQLWRRCVDAHMSQSGCGASGEWGGVAVQQVPLLCIVRFSLRA